MLQYERIDISEENKSNRTVECMICHYWYFKDLVLNINHMFVMGVMTFQ